MQDFIFTEWLGKREAIHELRPASEMGTKCAEIGDFQFTGDIERTTSLLVSTQLCWAGLWKRADKSFACSSFLHSFKNHTDLKSIDMSSMAQLKYSEILLMGWFCVHSFDIFISCWNSMKETHVWEKSAEHSVKYEVLSVVSK